MQGRVNYLLVGSFVVLFLVGIFGFAFWLMKYGNYEQMDRYVVYFDESVAGLGKDSSVKYMGVDAGVVENISVHPKNTQLVAVHMKIDHQIKIKEDMRATLKFYGMTGLAYVEIFGFDPDSPIIGSKADEPVEIKSSPSLFASLDDTLAKLTNQFTSASQQIEKLLSDENIAHVTQTLDNISAVTSELKKNKLEQKAALLIENLQHATEGLDSRFGKDLHQSVREFKAASKQMKTLMQTLNTSAQQGDYNLKDIASPATQKLSIILDEMSDVLGQMHHTLERIEESPSDLIFKKAAVKPGPGE